MSQPGNSRIGGDSPGEGGPEEKQWRIASWGSNYCSIQASPMLPREMLWALLINHLLSTHYVPTTLHLTRYLAFSTTPFTDKETKTQREKGLAWNQPSFAQGLEDRGSKGAVVQM